jgi:prevent-host-death family protein
MPRGCPKTSDGDTQAAKTTKPEKANGNGANLGSMRKFTSADAKNHFGELIDAARAAPVAITKYERPVVVMVASEEYDRLMALRAKAKKAQRPRS